MISEEVLSSGTELFSGTELLSGSFPVLSYIPVGGSVGPVLSTELISENPVGPVLSYFPVLS